MIAAVGEWIRRALLYGGAHCNLSYLETEEGGSQKLARPYLKNKIQTIWMGGYGSSGRQLLSMLDVLGSIPSTAKQKGGQAS
jgi:hypothetical protein